VTLPVFIERDGEIGLICLDNPPVNALSQAAREGLLRCIEELDTDRSIRGILIHGIGRHFSAGADIHELDRPRGPPLLADVLLRLERCSKPVAAALHGAVLGGGAELALACHYRYAFADLQFGLPEIRLGLFPGGGGPLRLFRLLDLTVALDLMISGTPIRLARAVELGLVDRPTDGDPRVSALSCFRELLAAGAGVRPRIDNAVRSTLHDATFLQAYRSGLRPAVRRLRAAENLLQCAEAALTQPAHVAQALANEKFEECRASRESQALRRLFLAEHRSRRTSVSPRPVKRVAVIGAGTMGSGIATSMAHAGLEVVLVDQSERALDSGLSRLHANIASAVRKGRVSAADAAAARARVQGTGALADIAAADLVVEAITENLNDKRKLFSQLALVTRSDAVLASNTSTLDVDELAMASGRGDAVVGMHFFSPAHVMPLIEVVQGRLTSPTTLETALAVSRRLKKIGVVVGNGFGFVGNGMLYAYGREKEFMLLEGATPKAIDDALEHFGMAMGPNAVGDLAGLDIGVAARRAWRDRPDDPRFYRASELLADRGFLGQKSGRGFYRYDEGRQRHENPEALSLIQAEAERLGVHQRPIADQEIVERCIFALINEGARLLGQGIARSAADIDVIWCNGYGFPRELGGPMFYGDTEGAGKLAESIRSFAARFGERYWAVAPLLNEVAIRGERLADWSAPEIEL